MCIAGFQRANMSIEVPTTYSFLPVSAKDLLRAQSPSATSTLFALLHNKDESWDDQTLAAPVRLQYKQESIN